MNANNKPEPWGKSEAKETVRKLLLADNFYMDVDEHELYQMSETFQVYPEHRFVSNVKNLKKSIKTEKNWNEFEEAALIQDRQRFPKTEMTYWNYIMYDTAEAKPLLRTDIQNKKHTTMKPAQLHQTKDAYKKFPLDVFRKHIYQEEYAQLGRSYWMNKRKCRIFVLLRFIYSTSGVDLGEIIGGIRLWRDLR